MLVGVGPTEKHSAIHDDGVVGQAEGGGGVQKRESRERRLQITSTLRCTSTNISLAYLRRRYSRSGSYLDLR